MQEAVEEVHLASPLAEYAVAIARATRDSPQLAVGASPRGSLALMKLARARAAYLGRDFVTPDDIKAVAVPALAHRLTLAPELWVQRFDPAEAVRAAVASVPVPVLDESA
jgi:MoxR-like ATPase